MATAQHTMDSRRRKARVRLAATGFRDTTTMDRLRIPGNSSLEPVVPHAVSVRQVCLALRVARSGGRHGGSNWASGNAREDPSLRVGTTIDWGGMVTPKPLLLDRVRSAIRLRHYSPRTEEAYVAWARRFVLFHGKRHPETLGAEAVTEFLTHLAKEERVSASTQNQALAALLFLYVEVLGLRLEDLHEQHCGHNDPGG